MQLASDTRPRTSSCSRARSRTPPHRAAAAVMHRAAVVAALVLVLAACCLDVAGSYRLHEKTRYDRSISDNILGSSGIRVVNKKPRIFTDEATLYSAYKDAGQSVCYLEKLKRSELDDADLWLDVIRSNKKMLHSSDRLLTKLEAWRLAGGRIVEFCKGMKMLLLDDKSVARSGAFAAAAAALPDPLDNVLPGEENDGVARRRVAAAATAAAPPRIRGKRDAPPSTPAEMETEKREGTGPLEGHQERRKREAGPRGARFRGQTQSQYLSLGGDGKPGGEAEAEASQQSSRALVSGSSGMGQAQSMSSGNEGCDGCLGYERIGSFPVGIQGILGSQQNLPTGGITGTNPSGIVPGAITTGPRTGANNYSPEVPLLPETYPPRTQTGIPTSTIGGLIPSTVTRPETAIGMYQVDIPYTPGTQVSLPGGQQLDRNSYPTPIMGGSQTGTQVPGQQLSQTPDLTSSGKGLGTQIPNGRLYPPSDSISTGTQRGRETPNSEFKPGTQINTYPGALPSTLTGGGQYSPGMYLSNIQLIESGIPGVYILGETTYPGLKNIGGSIPISHIPTIGSYTPGAQVMPPRTNDQNQISGIYSTRPQTIAIGNQGNKVFGGTYIPHPPQIDNISKVGGYNSNIPLTGFPITVDSAPGMKIVPVSSLYVPRMQLSSGSSIPSSAVPMKADHQSGMQTPRNEPYLSRLQTLGDIISKSQASGVYSPNSQVFYGNAPGTQTTGTQLYAPRMKIEDSIPETQTLAGGSSPLRVQAVETGVLEKEPSTGEICIPSNQIIGGGNSEIPTQGSPVYPLNVQISRFFTSGAQTPMSGFYIPNTQIFGNSNSGIQTSSRGVYQPNTEIRGTAPGERVYPSMTSMGESGNVVSQTGGGGVYLANTLTPASGDTTSGIRILGRRISLTNTRTDGGVNPKISIPDNGFYSPGGPIIQGSYPTQTIEGGQTSGGNVYLPGISGSQIQGSHIYSLNSQFVPSTGGTSRDIAGLVYPANIPTVGGSSQGPQIPYPSVYQGVGSPSPQLQIPGSGIYSPGMHIINRGKLGTQYPSTSDKHFEDVQMPGLQSPTAAVNPGDISQGTSIPSGILYPSGISTDTTGQVVQKPIVRGDIPGTAIYPDAQQGGSNAQSTTIGSGVPVIIPGDVYPSLTGSRQVYPGSGPAFHPGTNMTSAQYPGTGLLTGQGAPISGSNVPITGSGAMVNVARPTTTGGSIIGGDDGSDSQAMSSVKQDDAGTLASASAEGRHAHGSAKSQVSGIYTGSGSFSAQAGTSDDSKSAQTQVSGDKEGAKSSAQSSGGLGKSQTQVELDSDSGSTSTNAQSSGWNHGTNTKVQASGKGGMADAQANGEGQTSSQAQIGFQPYVNRKEKLEKFENPFRGGGTASAQSGNFRGQSQSQLQGSFHYGITYTGAAQAGSGSGAAALRKPFNFTNSDPSFFKPFKLEDNEKVKSTTEDPPAKEQLQGSSSSSRKTVFAITSRNSQSEKKSHIEQIMHQPYDNDDVSEEYDDEDYIESTFSSTSRPTSFPPQTTKQSLRVIADGEYDVSVKQQTSNDAGQTLPGYIAPRAKLSAAVSKKIETQRDAKFQSQMVSRSTGNQTSTYRSAAEVASSDTKASSIGRIGGIYYGSMKNFSENSSPETTYVSVANSVSGKMDDKSPMKKYEHRYYTKSSTCGYFTFSCNIVYGSNGKRKICKPKLPTYADGTPKC